MPFMAAAFRGHVWGRYLLVALLGPEGKQFKFNRSESCSGNDRSTHMNEEPIGVSTVEKIVHILASNQRRCFLPRNF